MKKLGIVLGVLLMAGSVFGQAPTVATPFNHIGFGMTGADLATVTGYTYRGYFDGSATGVILTGVTCTGSASPFNCQSNWPSLSDGAHTVQLTAADAAGESVKSVVFNFPFQNIPAAPTNVRIVP